MKCSTSRRASTRNRFAAIGVALLIAFGVFFSIAVRRVVSRPLEQIAAAAGQLAAGDLAVRLSGSGTASSRAGVRDDEIGRLMRAIDGTPGPLSVQDIFDFLNAWFAGC